MRASTDGLENKIAKCFGDSQQYDGGWFAEYDGKWIDVTNDVMSLKELFKSQQLSLIERIPKPIESPSDIRCGNSRPLKEREIVMKSYNKCLSDVEAALRKELQDE